MAANFARRRTSDDQSETLSAMNFSTNFWVPKAPPRYRLQGRTQHSSKVANEPPAKNQPALFFSLFAFSHGEACFLTNESKANEFDRRSFATLELKLRS